MIGSGKNQSFIFFFFFFWYFHKSLQRAKIVMLSFGCTCPADKLPPPPPLPPGPSLVAQLVKNPPAMQETLVQFLDWEDPLEKGMATHSSILVWRIPWTIQSMGVTKSPTRLTDFHFFTFPFI